MSDEIYFGAETENKHFDVGLVGWWFASNYGSAMTYYGLGKILEDMGLSSLMIQIPKLNNTPWEPQVKKTMDFMGKYFPISKYRPVDHLKEYNALCDTFMLGSDQLWTRSAIDLVGYTFFLDFAAQGKKKIAFATSFGHEKFSGTDEQKANASAILKTFDYISVRENSGIKASKDNFGIDVHRDLDPVFICDKKHYDALAEKSSMNDEDYLLCYILDPTEEKQAAVKYASEKLNLKVIALLDMKTEDRRKAEWHTGDLRLNPSIEDFIYYFKHCKFLMTDSHHGVCFGIIYNKNFISIANYSRGITRFIHLLDLFKLSDKLIYDPNKIIGSEAVFKEINYEKVNEILNSEKSISLARLKEALNAEPKNLPIPVLKNSAREGIFASYNEDSKLKPAAITSVLNITECTGCGACVSACPKDALSLKQDKWGYYRSSLNVERCINCGLCSKVCPALNLPQKNNKKDPMLYAFIAADEKVLGSSSSGGVFTLLANETFKRGGCVAGASWTGDLHVEHIMIENKEDLYKLQKSKYLQSFLGDFDRKIKEKLDAGRFVLFSGCPCQVAGLKAYLGKEYDNLITVDLLCGSAPSSEFFQKYLKDSFPDGVKDYQFRYKKQGMGSDCLTVAVTLNDGTRVERRGGEQDDYQKLFHPHILCPPHCEQCKYQSLPRFGDITIGDFWGFGQRDSSVDIGGGISAVLCNDEKGQAFFNSIPDEEIKFKNNVPLEWLGGNGYAVTGHNFSSPDRDKFYKAIQTMPFSQAMKTALTPAKAADRVLNDQLIWMTNAANFFEKLSNDFMSDKKFDAFMNGMRGKKIAVLKSQDRAGKFMQNAAEHYGAEVVFSSPKANLCQLTDEEWQICKSADKIICCCVHGNVPDERDSIKGVSVLSLLQ